MLFLTGFLPLISEENGMDFENPKPIAKVSRCLTQSAWIGPLGCCFWLSHHIDDFCCCSGKFRKSSDEISRIKGRRTQIGYEPFATFSSFVPALANGSAVKCLDRIHQPTVDLPAWRGWVWKTLQLEIGSEKLSGKIPALHSKNFESQKPKAETENFEELSSLNYQPQWRLTGVWHNGNAWSAYPSLVGCGRLFSTKNLKLGDFL